MQQGRLLTRVSFRSADPSQVGQFSVGRNKAEKPKANVDELAGMVLTFFAGLSMEQNLKSSRAATGRKVDSLMRVLRSL
jgi:hypothetical protein